MYKTSRKFSVSFGELVTVAPRPALASERVRAEKKLRRKWGRGRGRRPQRMRSGTSWEEITENIMEIAKFSKAAPSNVGGYD